MQASLPLAGGFDCGPLFVIVKQRPLMRPKGHTGREYERNVVRRTPPWARTVVHRIRIAVLYAEARERTRQTGELHVVDHIVPLCGGIVSGLHVAWNLEVMHWRANAVKGARWWPHMPFEQVSLC